tara:strand:+ start:500 stop:709 length:210 start_codon:yes stop_codon:yes gene_type:complete
MRDYRKEYDNYHSKAKQRKNRSSRNMARRMLKNRVGIKGKDVHHKDGNPRNNSPSNLAITTKKYNRSKK